MLNVFYKSSSTTHFNFPKQLFSLIEGLDDVTVFHSALYFKLLLSWGLLIYFVLNTILLLVSLEKASV